MATSDDAVPAPAKTIEGTFTVLERSFIVTLLSRGLMLLGPAIFALAVTRVFPAGFVGIHLFLLGFVMTIAQRRNNRTAVRKERRVQITSNGVSINGELVVDRAKIADGIFQPRPTRDPRKKRSADSSVKLLDKRKNLLFEMETDEAKALEVLHLLGLDPLAKRASFRAASPVYSTLARRIAFIWGVVGVSALVGALTTMVGLHGFGTFLMFCVFMPVLLVGSWPSTIEVGVDGILVRWLWQKKFIPMSQIMNVAPSGDREISIQLASGRLETLATSQQRRRYGETRTHRDAVLARIGECYAAYKSGAATTDVAALVGRGSRTKSEWINALLKLRGQEGGYRDAVVREEDLWRVIEDPAAPEDARAGAAMAIRSTLDNAGKNRVRVMAEATASPKLRVAFDAAANTSTSDDEVSNALAELTEEAEDMERRRRALA